LRTRRQPTPVPFTHFLADTALYIYATLTIRGAGCDFHKHFRTDWRELHVGSGLVPPQPALGNAAVEARPVFVRRPSGAKERAIDEFDIDAPVLHRLGRVGDFDQLARGDFWVDERSVKEGSW
jgi:hypothetical protein